MVVIPSIDTRPGLGRRRSSGIVRRERVITEAPPRPVKASSIFLNMCSSPLLWQTSEHSHQSVTLGHHKDSTKVGLLLTAPSRLTRSSRGGRTTGLHHLRK